MTERGRHEDIKIDKDIRFLLRQEMKEMDWVVFHTSHSLSIPLRHPPLLPPPLACWLFGKETESVSVKWGQRSHRWWKFTYSTHQTTDGHTHPVCTLSPRGAHTHRCVAKALPWQLSYVPSRSGRECESLCVESVIERSHLGLTLEVVLLQKCPF